MCVCTEPMQKRVGDGIRTQVKFHIIEGPWDDLERTLGFQETEVRNAFMLGIGYSKFKDKGKLHVKGRVIRAVLLENRVHVGEEL